MLPNFLIIGAEKAATSWLAACLVEHPEVFIPPAKEVYFLTLHYAKGPAWYESFFEQGDEYRAIGEATPGYLSHPAVPGRIKELLGDIPLIASLRHPVDRAYSAFWHYKRQGRIPAHAPFEDWLRKGEDPCQIRTRGFYGDQLNRYFSVFPRDRILVLLYEEIQTAPLAAIRTCLSLLGIDGSAFHPKQLHARVNGARNLGALNGQAWSLRKKLRSAWQRIAADRIIPRQVRETLFRVARRTVVKVSADWGPTSVEYRPIDDELRGNLLSEIYFDDIKRLEDLLTRDLSCWTSRKQLSSLRVSA